MSSRTEKTSRIAGSGEQPEHPQQKDSKLPGFVDKLLPSALDNKLDKSEEQAAETGTIGASGAVPSTINTVSGAADAKPSQ